MEVSNASIVQGRGGGTLLCIPGDSLSDDKRLKKRSRRLLGSDSTGESHSNAKRPRSAPSFSFNLSGGAAKSLPDAASLDSSSVDSSGMPETDSAAAAEQSKHESWKFKTLVACSCESPSMLSSDVISTIDYDDTGKLIATGGLARKIRICSYQQLVGGDTGGAAGSKKLFTTICMPAKLSSLKWRPGSSEVIACGDYDGSVTEWDVEHGATISERYEHTGRTVWSIDYSRDAGDLLASASSDGTVRFWSRSVEGSVGTIRSANQNSMCCVEFGRCPYRYVAVACADAMVYLYDMRNLASPVVTLRGHDRSVSYVRWITETGLVSSSPDGTIRLWDVSSTTGSGGVHRSRIEDPLMRTFDSHSNSRNFVGLSVTSSGSGSGSGSGGGLIASGSETNEVFVYSSSGGRSVFRHRFPDAVVQDEKAFVGSVCWTKQEDYWSLISANSEGIVQVIRATPTTRPSSGSSRDVCY